MVIDYCSGGDLSVLLAQHSTFTEAESKFYISELILAIECLHDMDVLYRDLKPENILIDKNGHIKLADFGLAKEGIGKKDIAKSFCGSPIYLSPDMLNGKGASQSTDNYGIGLVLYEMLLGTTPFFTEDVPKLYKRIKHNKLCFPAPTEYLPEGDQVQQLVQSIKSKPSKTYIYIEFNNKSSESLTYLWKNHKQILTEKFTLRPGEHKTERTLISQPWIVYRSGTPLTAYNPSSSLKENQRLIITTNIKFETQVKKPAVSPECEDFLKRILSKEPEMRLGAYDKNELKDHPFFADLDWNKVKNREYKAPYIDDEEIEHFNRRLKLNDQDYTKENYNKLRIMNFTFVRESEID